MKTSQKCAKQSFLSLYTQQIENMAGNILTDATVCVRKVSWLVFTGRWEFDHISIPVVNNRNFLSISTVICFAIDPLAVCKINKAAHALLFLHKTFDGDNRRVQA